MRQALRATKWQRRLDSVSNDWGGAATWLLPSNLHSIYLNYRAQRLTNSGTTGGRLFALFLAKALSVGTREI